MDVLVTGANGFVGRALCLTLKQAGHRVRGAMRAASNRHLKLWSEIDEVVVGEISQETDWVPALEGIDAVVHLAARVHIMDDDATDPLKEFRKVNTLGTERLARMASAAGVNCFVCVSSKVNGESTGQDASGKSQYFFENDVPHPQDAYAVSKWQAEEGLQQIASETGMELVVVRPPLVYGPGVKANFFRLLKMVDQGIPLPLASVANSRSLVALDNLVDFLQRCIEHPSAAGEKFLVSDGEDLSTPELIRRIAHHMKRPARLVPFPPGILRLGGHLLKKGDLTDRLLGSLQVDIDKAQRILGWEPPVSIDSALEKTVAWYLTSGKLQHA